MNTHKSGLDSCEYAIAISSDRNREIMMSYAYDYGAKPSDARCWMGLSALIDSI